MTGSLSLSLSLSPPPPFSLPFSCSHMHTYSLSSIMVWSLIRKTSNAQPCDVMSSRLKPLLTQPHVHTPSWSSGQPTRVLTPSFQPAMGTTPMTQTVTQQMVSVASKPLMTLHVDTTSIGRASDTPSRIPSIALSTRACNISSGPSLSFLIIIQSVYSFVRVPMCRLRVCMYEIRVVFPDKVLLCVIMIIIIIITLLLLLLLLLVVAAAVAVGGMRFKHVAL